MDEPKQTEAGRSVNLCVVGGGFCGGVLSAGLVRAGYGGRIALIERGTRAGPGVAYDPPSERLLLNVPARNMSAWPDEPGDFVSWLARTGRASDPSAFVARRWYGEYLGEIVSSATEKSGGRLRVVRAEATRVTRAGSRWAVTLDSGESLFADQVCLALGNLRPGPPPGVDGARAGSWWCADPWAAKTHEPCRDGERVLVIGTGLTMADVCVSLTGRGARPRLTVLSRNGLLPCVHASAPGGVSAVPARVGAGLREIVRHVRSEARRVMREGGDWRSAVDCLRPITPALWEGMPEHDRARFVARLRTHWDVHRHRVPAEVLGRLVELVQRRALRIVAGRVRSVECRGESAEVTWTPRGGGAPRTEVFDRVVNCTGARTSIAASPLLSGMASEGLLSAEPLGLGVMTDGAGRAIDAAGRAHRSLSVIGPLRRGTLWESTAVPELRVQAAALVGSMMAAIPN